jgi:hypothetical protein
MLFQTPLVVERLVLPAKNTSKSRYEQKKTTSNANTRYFVLSGVAFEVVLAIVALLLPSSRGNS